MAKPQTPALTVDVVMPSEIPSEKDHGKVVLIRRANKPFEDHWGLPGGFEAAGESVKDAALREVQEETGLHIEIVSLVRVYSKPDRDPRGHNVSIAYLARTISGSLNSLKAASDAAEARLVDAREVREVSFAFDHREIIDDTLSILQPRI